LSVRTGGLRRFLDLSAEQWAPWRSSIPKAPSWCVVFLLVLTASLSAQTATVRGRVTDQSGALVQASKVTLVGSDGRARNTKADDNGIYFFTAVAPGKYTVQASALGLTMPQPAEIVLKPGIQTLDLQLTVTSMEEK